MKHSLYDQETGTYIQSNSPELMEANCSMDTAIPCEPRIEAPAADSPAEQLAQRRALRAGLKDLDGQASRAVREAVILMLDSLSEDPRYSQMLAPLNILLAVEEKADKLRAELKKCKRKAT